MRNNKDNNLKQVEPFTYSVHVKYECKSVKVKYDELV